MHKVLGMDRARTDDSDLKKKKKGHSYHVVLCWTIKAGIKKEKGGNFGNDGICFPKTIHAHEFSALLCARSFYFT